MTHTEAAAAGPQRPYCFQLPTPSYKQKSTHKCGQCMLMKENYDLMLMFNWFHGDNLTMQLTDSVSVSFSPDRVFRICLGSAQPSSKTLTSPCSPSGPLC